MVSVFKNMMGLSLPAESYPLGRVVAGPYLHTRGKELNTGTRCSGSPRS